MREAKTSPARELSVYDGQDRIGMLIARAGSFDAFDQSGIRLGSFKKLKAAADAVSSSQSTSCAREAMQRGPGASPCMRTRKAPAGATGA
jgi:hypothetical protein